MANHSLVGMREPLDTDAAEAILKEIVHGFWGERLSVVRYEEVSDKNRALYSCMWSMIVPGTGLSEDVALNWDKAPDDEFGFEVWLDIDRVVWEFRHPHNHWERWAQDKVQHTLAKRFETHIEDEGVGRIEADPEGLKESYTAFVTRNFPEPRAINVREWVDRHIAQAPAGFE